MSREMMQLMEDGNAVPSVIVCMDCFKTPATRLGVKYSAVDEKLCSVSAQFVSVRAIANSVNVPDKLTCQGCGYISGDHQYRLRELTQTFLTLEGEEERLMCATDDKGQNYRIVGLDTDTMSDAVFLKLQAVPDPPKREIQVMEVGDSLSKLPYGLVLIQDGVEVSNVWATTKEQRDFYREEFERNPELWFGSPSKSDPITLSDVPMVSDPEVVPARLVRQVADLYAEKRSDVCEILYTLADEGFVDDNLVERRFVKMEVPMDLKKGTVVLYDTLTTLFSICDPDTLEPFVDDTAIKVDYSD